MVHQILWNVASALRNEHERHSDGRYSVIRCICLSVLVLLVTSDISVTYQPSGTVDTVLKGSLQMSVSVITDSFKRFPSFVCFPTSCLAVTEDCTRYR